MVNKPVISHFHSFIMTENLLELKCKVSAVHCNKGTKPIKEVHFFHKPDTVYSLIR